MKKIFLSFSLIVAFALFATFSRRNVGLGSETTSPVYIPKRVVDAKPVGQQKDGSYTGSVADAFYGNIQVKAVIQDGKLSDVVFLQYPNDRRTSIEINTQAMPYLKAEAIQIQSGNVDIVSGATDSSIAFRESMASALAQAKN